MILNPYHSLTQTSLSNRLKTPTGKLDMLTLPEKNICTILEGIGIEKGLSK